MASLPHQLISRIAIIGAGPSGISAAKYLLAEKAFGTIDVFEQRSEVGGVWNLTANTLSKETPIPQLDPNYHIERQAVTAITIGTDGDSCPFDRADRFETPLYDMLETNIPKQLMQYANVPFDHDLPLFPGHRDVLEYCKQYAEDIRPLIRFGFQVSEVRAVSSESLDGEYSSGWIVTTIDGKKQEQTVHRYDAVVLATGHFSVPFVPAIKGIEAWSSSYRGSIMHSKAYRGPDLFAGKKVIVVGNSASGMDIGAQIAQVCEGPLLQSSRTENVFSPESSPWKKDIPQIVEFLDPKLYDRSVRMADGRVESDVDAVLFATGYFYSFPFLQIEAPVITDGLRTRDVYQHLFHINYPTLAFPILPQRIIPFPMAENQAAVIARVWSRRLALPSASEMRAWETRLLEDRGDGKEVHRLYFPEDADYLNMLYDWAASALPRPGLQNEGVGLMGTRWENKQRWMRSLIPVFKMAYAQRGKNRFSVKTVEELGFTYEDWKEAHKEEAGGQEGTG